MMNLLSKLKTYFRLTDIVDEIIKSSGDNYILKDEKLVDVQNTLLDIYADVMKVCDENNLKLSLIGGTLLGKVRHNGFIPWDDDMDLAMPRNDYDRLKQIFSKTSLSEKYIIRGPECEEGTFTRFIKIYKKNSILEMPYTNGNTINKIWIDIFPIDYVPERKLAYRIKGMKSEFLYFTTSILEFYQYGDLEFRKELKKTKRGRINLLVRDILGRMCSHETLEKRYKRYENTLRYKGKSSNCTIAVGVKGYFGETVCEEVFYPFKRTDFCGIPAWIPNYSELYLENRYGNYMIVPPIEKREYHFVKRVECDVRTEDI